MTLAGASAYYYVIDEYKLGNDMLTEDIYVSFPLVEAYLRILSGLDGRKAGHFFFQHGNTIGTITNRYLGVAISRSTFTRSHY